MDKNKISNAPYWKRILAFAVDAVLSIGIGFLLFTFVTSTYLYESLGGVDAEQKIATFYDESGLISVKKKEDGTYDKSSFAFFQYKAYEDEEISSSTYTLPPEGREAFEAYYEKVYNYYTVLLPLSGENDFEPLKDKDGNDFTSVEDYKRYFNTTIFSLPTLEDSSKVDEASRSSSSNPFFCLPLNEEGTVVDVLGKPVLKREYQEKVASKDKDTLKKLRDFFFDGTAKEASSVGCYYNAVTDVMGTGEGSVQIFATSQNEIASKASAISQVTAFIPLVFVFFFLIPVSMPSGKTIGKLFFNLPVVNADGYGLTWYQRILRPLYMSVLCSLLFVPYTIAIMAFFLVFLVDALTIGFSKSGLSLHDRLLKTNVIDGKTSKYFKNAEEKERFYEEHPEEAEVEEKPRDYEMEAAIRESERVLDLDTIMRHREEARAITSFDEFEQRKDKEMEELKAKAAEKSVNLSKEDETK